MAAPLPAQPTAGYYRFPAIHADTVVFTAESNLWKVSASGGAAQRLTSHAGYEILPSISPDGQRVAFTGQYEGPQEVYVMPLGGGIWLTGSNTLVDRGVARAVEFGSFIPGEGWVIEGGGFTPDIIVDNNPARAFGGEDAQLDAAIRHLQALIAKDPRHKLPVPPPWPDKSLKAPPAKKKRPRSPVSPTRCGRRGL